MKRAGYLHPKMLLYNNCEFAELETIKNKDKNIPIVKRIKNNLTYYAERLQNKLINGYNFHPYRTAVIKDSYKGKERELKIPTIEDQAAMNAWLNIAVPYIMNHNYYYNCGSVYFAGQNRAVKALQKWLKSKPKWGGISDIKQFYKNCPHWLVIKGLNRLFKDKEFIGFAEKILKAMSNTEVGLAIGFPVSHWFANVALMELDHELEKNFPDVKFVRYQDDIAYVCRRKRHLQKAIAFVRKKLNEYGMEIKHTWQVFPIKSRGISFLSYRFFHGYTLLNKQLMYRIARKMRRTQNHFTERMVRGVIAYKGILKHCNSYNFRQKYVYPYVDFKKCKRYIKTIDKERRCAT